MEIINIYHKNYTMDKEFLKMQKLAGLITENQAGGNNNESLTNDEQLRLESALEQFLNKVIFSTDIVNKEEEAIEFIIQSLKDRISYYPDSV
jgi:hypothetical protein